MLHCLWRWGVCLACARTPADACCIAAAACLPACRGYSTGYHWVWISIGAWGIGSTVLSTVMFMIAASYMSAASGEAVVVKPGEGGCRGGLCTALHCTALSSGGAAPVCLHTPACLDAFPFFLPSLPVFLPATDFDDLSVKSTRSLDASVGASSRGRPSPKARGDAELEEGGLPAGAVPKSTLPFTPVRMTFQDLKYSVPLPAVRIAGACAVVLLLRSCLPPLRCCLLGPRLTQFHTRQ